MKKSCSPETLLHLLSSMNSLLNHLQPPGPCNIWRPEQGPLTSSGEDRCTFSFRASQPFEVSWPVQWPKCAVNSLWGIGGSTSSWQSVHHITITTAVQIGVPGRLSARRKCAALRPACSDEVIMDTQLSALSTYGRAITGAITGVITLGSYPGIIAQENRHSILGLTCRLEKSINVTAAIIRDLQNEIEELNQDMLQQRFAIDYLLARQGGFCTLVGQRACAVHFHSLNKTIEDELANLQASIKDNVHEKFSPFDWLTNWLPDFSWLKLLFFYGLIVFVFLISCGCFMQCIPSFCALFRKPSPITLHPIQLRAIEKSLFSSLKTKSEEMKGL
ncbi:uncharacterized protein LOC131197580 [Ahaetulla prasina]|uniref:uncharacterized protein LOC131197580 n=1 Tax=Ahaetulla prasina TaxID=499056 RepID=UPI002648B35D|nr:uncharacterized protein LOC131197580 [Ahaetulla prasina]